MAKVICLTRGTPRFRAYKWIEDLGYPVHYIVDDETQAMRVRSMAHLGHVHVTRLKRKGQDIVAQTRDWAMRNVVDVNEWCIWVDDNVARLTALPEQFRADRIDFDLDDEPLIGWREGFEERARDPKALVDGLMRRCELEGTIFGGFAIETNYFFRRLRYQWWGYVRTQLAVYRNDGSSWLTWPGMMLEDFVKSVDVVCRYGKVVIDRMAKPIKPSFEEGGIGSFQERLPHLRHDCAKLMEAYPGLLRPVKEGVDFQLTFAKRSQATIDDWRRQAGYFSEPQGRS